MQGKLAKLTILSFMDAEVLVPNLIPKFEVYYNPDSYSVTQTVQYCAAEAFGSDGSEMRFIGIPPKEYSFKLVFDGTGASGPKIDVTTALAQFHQVTAGYIGQTHRAPFLILYWGSLVDKCVLKSSQVSYKLFDPQGIPLRAEVSVTFSTFTFDELKQAKMFKQSPDMTHRRVVKAGDSLPLMCKAIYNDESKYLEVARVNGIVNYRKLVVGSEIYFPPVNAEA